MIRRSIRVPVKPTRRTKPVFDPFRGLRKLSDHLSWPSVSAEHLKEGTIIKAAIHKFSSKKLRGIIAGLNASMDQEVANGPRRSGFGDQRDEMNALASAAAGYADALLARRRAVKRRMATSKADYNPR